MGSELPRGPRTLLRLVLPGDWRNDILRDLEEAFRKRRASRGPAGARLWLWGQVLAFSLRFAPARLAEVAGPATFASLDVKLALRAVVRSPGLSLLAVLSLALGIASASGVFTVVEGAFFTPIPYSGGDRIVQVSDYSPARSQPLLVAPEEFLRRRARLESFEYLGAYRDRAVVVGGGEDGGPGRRVMARLVTPEILEMTEVSPRIGRLPDAADSRAGEEPVVVLPHFLWQSHLGSDPQALGRSLLVDGVRRTVIGVMPEGFAFPLGNELWIPLDPRNAEGPLRLIGKLREGVDPATARVEVETVARPDPGQLASPDEEVEHAVRRLDRPLSEGGQLVGLGLPLGALVLLLLVMATNVAMVVLARNAARSEELAVRTALGAGRWRIVGQLALEVGILVVVASALGLALARRGVAAFEAGVRPVPFWVDFSLDGRVVSFTLGLAALVTLVAGLAPALRVTAGRLHESLENGARGASKVRFGRLAGALIVAELAVCVGLLSTGAVVGRSLLSTGYEDYDLPLRETLVARLDLEGPRAIRKREAILERARDLPEVRMAAAGSRFPGSESERETVRVEGPGGAGPASAEVATVGPGYFELLDVAPIRGRLFTAAEHADGPPVTIVDRAFVRAHFGSGNAVGRRIRLGDGDGNGSASPPWLEIVGVVPEIGLSPLRSDVGAAFRPLGDAEGAGIALRGREGRPVRVPILLETVRKADPEVRVLDARTLEARMGDAVSLIRGLGIGVLLLGGVALLLSGASLHALTSAAVTRRTRELGIRRALGAHPRDLLFPVLRRTTGQLSLGLLLGALLSLTLLRIASIFPWELERAGLLDLAGVAVSLGCAVLVALAGPLRRALGIRPADALRAE